MIFYNVVTRLQVALYVCKYGMYLRFISRLIYTSILLCLLNSTFVDELYAQTKPFSTIEISTSISQSNLIDDNFSEFWKPGDKFSISVSTPFYLGYLSAYVDFIDYEAISDRTVGFNTVNYALGLSHRLALTQLFIVDGKANFGIQEIAQDVPNVTSDSIERELFYAFSLEPGIRTKYLFLFGSLEYRKIFNFNRQNLYFIGAGIRVRLFLPDKVRSFID